LSNINKIYNAFKIFDKKVTLNWTGTDDANRVGIATFDLYVKKDAGDFHLFQSDIDTTYFLFDASNRHQSSFYTHATDYVDNQEPEKFTGNK